MSKVLAGFTRGKWVLGSRGVKRRNDDPRGLIVVLISFCF